MRVNVYVAFSIHGSNNFVSVNKELDLPLKPSVGSFLTIDNREFQVERSRGTPLNGAVKLLTTLLNGPRNKPTRDRTQVIKAFSTLISEGWKLHTCPDIYSELKQVKSISYKALEPTPEAVSSNSNATPPLISDQIAAQAQAVAAQPAESVTEVGNPTSVTEGNTTTDVHLVSDSEVIRQAQDIQPNVKLVAATYLVADSGVLKNIKKLTETQLTLVKFLEQQPDGYTISSETFPIVNDKLMYCGGSVRNWAILLSSIRSKNIQALFNVQEENKVITFRNK